ncbi:MAG: stage 0 sporulation protein [Deltaproteobacteria bacterium]|nr:stage 0 sporulation protein [Deltaproteobacteria bacterium]
MVKRYAGVSFRCSRKVYCFNIGALHLKTNDTVVVETDRGVNMGKVVVPPERAELPAGVDEDAVKKVLRKARDDDFEKLRENSAREIEASQVCRDMIKAHKLKMKLVQAEIMHDSNRVIFYFTAENRVDFRELVKELAHALHVRVEMRQIGIRDAAGMAGGVGICGRELCCAAFLSTFAPVTVKMAKEQNLALNPMKISGICGRLMCCLGYEYENYRNVEGRARARRSRSTEPESIKPEPYETERKPEIAAEKEPARAAGKVSEKKVEKKSEASASAEGKNKKGSRNAKGSNRAGSREKRKKEQS